MSNMAGRFDCSSPVLSRLWLATVTCAKITYTKIHDGDVIRGVSAEIGE